MAETLRKPLRLPCGLVLPNRLCKTATSEHMADVITGEPQPELARLYGAWAKGGAGLIITGNVMVDDHLEGPGNVVARGVEPSETWKAWAKASKMCRENSSDQPVAIVQLSHPGRQSPPSVTWARPVAPSAVPFHLPGVGVQLFRRPRPLATAELQQLPERFAAAARLAVAAGFDGVQIHSAHGYLLSQFLSPHTNRRDDAYGGSAAKRRRLLLEILAAVRLAIGTRCMLSVKVNCADFRVGGLDQADALELMTELQKATVDLVEISGGTYETMAMMKPNDEEGSEGYFVDFSRRVRNEVRGLPVMAVGGFKSLSGSAKAIIDGDCDVVGLCRSLCLQPSLPSLWLQGEDIPTRSKSVRLWVPFFGDLLIPGLGPAPAMCGDQPAYEETLMKYHGWFLQKSLKIALRALPSKDAIVQSDGLVVQGDLPLDKKRELCERDAPVASTEAIEVVHLVFDMMKQTGRWDDRKA